MKERNVILCDHVAETGGGRSICRSANARWVSRLFSDPRFVHRTLRQDAGQVEMMERLFAVHSRTLARTSPASAESAIFLAYNLARRLAAALRCRFRE
jgi:hypothetical protein